MFESILLEKEQEELLFILVEATRNVPQQQRQKFYAITSVGSTLSHILHPGFANNDTQAYMGDIEILGHQGLLALTYGDHQSVRFDVTPLGFRYYEYLKQRAGQPIQQIEAQSRNYLEGDLFQRKYPQAYQKWSDAESMLWSSESEQQLTTIGHLCRESLQEFATALVEQYKPINIDQNTAHTVARIKAVLETQRERLGTTLVPFLDAMLVYWGTVNDLVQRQEHGGQKEGQPLIWEDARRVVFQTGVVMFEISTGLARIS